MCTALPHHTVYQSHLLLWRGKRITCRLHGDVVMHFAGDESITLELQIRESYFRSRTGALIFECRSRLCSMLMRTTFFFMKKKKKRGNSLYLHLFRLQLTHLVGTKRPNKSQSSSAQLCLVSSPD